MHQNEYEKHGLEVWKLDKYISKRKTMYGDKKNG